MKAVIYIKPNVVEVIDTDIPELSDGEALIKVHRAGICGTDVAIAIGKHPRAKGPLVLGHEFAGEIVEIKSAKVKTNLTTGDNITVYPLLSCGQCWACRNGNSHVCRSLRMVGIDQNGGMAEYAKAPLDLIVRLPESITYEQGALIEPLAVGVHAVTMAGTDHSEACVIMGAGPIGLLVGLCLKSIPARKIIMTDINNERLQTAERLGFEAYNTQNCNIAEKILDATNGEGVDTLFECAGSESAAIQMCELVRPRGKISMVAVHKELHKVDLRAINFKEITMSGVRVYTRQDYEQAIRMIEKLPVLELISDRVGIDSAPDALDKVKKGQALGKVMIEIGR
jgi:threonine dehydrogenase-like Zn-dependent dehydrogenase